MGEFVSSCGAERAAARHKAGGQSAAPAGLFYGTLLRALPGGTPLAYSRSLPRSGAGALESNCTASEGERGFLSPFALRGGGGDGGGTVRSYVVVLCR